MLELKPSSSKWILFVIFILAVLIRFLPFNHVFNNGAVFFFDGDCYLHLRKILLHIKSFPSFITFDYYEGFPLGTPAIWPPLLDYILSVISMVIGLGSPSVRQVEVIGAAVPPFIGGLTILAVYYFARNVFNKEIALISSALLALIPAHINYTVIGRPDNEMMEPLMAAVLFFSYVRLQSSDIQGKARFSIMLYVSIVAFLYLLFWRGATLWIMLIAFGVLSDITMDFIRGYVLSKRYLYGAGIFLVLGAFLFFFCLFNVWGNQNTFSFNIVSWFHVTAFGVTAACIVAYSYLCAYWLRMNFRKATLVYFIAVAGVLVSAVILLLSPSLRDNIVKGLGIVGIGKLDPWIQSISEYQPFIHWKNFSFYLPAKELGWVFWLLPLIIGYMAFDMYKKGADRGRIFFLASTVFILAMSLLRRRFVHILAINVAISGGWLIYFVYKVAMKKTATRPKTLAVSSTVLLAAVIFYPLGINAYFLPSKHPGFSIKGYIENAMLWLRDNTPAPKDPYDPAKKPPYSVMARWDFGGWIGYIAERPVVATLYGNETYGLEESAAFYLAQSEAEANAVMEKTGAKYVVAVKIIGSLETYARIIGLAPEDYVRLVYSPKLKKKVYNPGEKYSYLISTGLLLTDGMDMLIGNLQFKGADHYRLVYESAERLNLIGFPFEVKKLKVFEYLHGATLKATTVPGQKVSVVSTVMTNRGRIFNFMKEGQAKSDGTIVFVLPYAELSKPGTIGLIAPYTIRSGEYSLTLSLSEEDLHKRRQFEIRIP